MFGVSFQPGAQGFNQNGNGQPSQSPSGAVQEAIKILSLRLPKVVGAQASVPMPLLTSQGSGGNPRVNSVVNQIMARFGGQGAPSMPAMPSGQPSGPNFAGASAPYQQAPQMPSWLPPSWTPPRVVVDTPRTGTDADLSQGGGQPPNMIGDLPPGLFQPPPAPNPGWTNLGSQLGSYQGGSDQNPFDMPLF